MFRRVAAWLVALMLAIAPAAVAADDTVAGTADPPEPPPNKLTVAVYDFSSGTKGIDANLRHTFAHSTAWIGGYSQDDGFDQARAGYQYDYHRAGLTLVPSVQAASHGFVAAAVYGEVGQRIFAIGGAGRTNLRPYWNLGFDPNDYAQVGVGFHPQATDTLSVYVIHDNRLRTGQTNTHAYFRQPVHGWRLTVDTTNEHGRGDDGLVVRGWAMSVEADRTRWFLRVAEDPRVNYTADRQWRIVTGTRF